MDAEILVIIGCDNGSTVLNRDKVIYEPMQLLPSQEFAYKEQNWKSCLQNIGNFPYGTKC